MVAASTGTAPCYSARSGETMRQSKILGFFAPCLFGFAACAANDPEPPLTPASYTVATHASRTPTKVAPPTRGIASRPKQKAESLAREAPPPVVTGTEGDDARTAIALARCQREARCKNVGQDREFVTEEDCITRLEPDTERELEASGCPRTIPSARLGSCMTAIRQQSCDGPRALAPIDECSRAALCKNE
jgi:Family of unknown function (DUF6184)